MQDSSIIDLHCHSTASDGTYAPKEVAALAQKIGLSAIALTDHETPSASKPSQALNLPRSGSISTVPKSILSA